MNAPGEEKGADALGPSSNGTNPLAALTVAVEGSVGKGKVDARMMRWGKVPSLSDNALYAGIAGVLVHGIPFVPFKMFISVGLGGTAVVIGILADIRSRGMPAVSELPLGSASRAIVERAQKSKWKAWVGAFLGFVPFILLFVFIWLIRSS